jgi:putative ABC transport system permease protein
MTYFLRASGDPAALIEAAKQVVWDADPLETFYQTATVRQLVSKTVAARRFNLLLLGAFAGIALVMAGVGIYGVISFTVSRRTHEVGIRMALGANRRDVITLVMRQGLGPALAGIVLGVLGAAGLTGVLSSQLFGVASRDAFTFSGSALLLLVIALLAAVLPARRAARVDPLAALRSE